MIVFPRTLRPLMQGRDAGMWHSHSTSEREKLHLCNALPYSDTVCDSSLVRARKDIPRGRIACAPKRAWCGMENVYDYALWGLVSVSALGIGLAFLVW